MVAASSLAASAVPNSGTWNRSLLSGFTPRYDMKIIAMMIIKMYVASMKNKVLAIENKYLSRTITCSEHKDEHLGVLSDLQTGQENTFVVTKAIPDTKPEQPSGPDTIKAEERKVAATWLIATAASHHATGDHSLLSGFTPEDGLFVKAGDGSPMQVLGRGSVVTGAVVLPDVWFVPGLTANLVSVSKLTELDYSVGFARAACYIRCAADGTVIGKAHAGEDGMFELDFLRVPPAS
ncbi:uncharacterized protein LOC123398863 [Hordeum vulgare subsp. vulgare]|uniref:uncharacterized protein LOC123398863 n=1 Tax=Hordeum vulgare subsp. vulgare TaxID=112509 RepID=UPI000295A6B7|nr:uncharacterized protein LOC123398863 [Hordeum vulgare subsp. vulgare]